MATLKVEFTLTIAFSLSYILFYIYDEGNRWLLSYTLQRVMNMATNKNKHLTQDDRNVIAIGIVNGSSKKAIADNLGKDKSTIGKEIRKDNFFRLQGDSPVRSPFIKNRNRSELSGSKTVSCSISRGKRIKCTGL